MSAARRIIAPMSKILGVGMLLGCLIVSAFAADTVKSCVIVKRHRARGADAITRWTTPAPFDYVEGDYPPGEKFRHELKDKHVQKIQQKGGKVVVLKEDYSLAELDDARKACQQWINPPKDSPAT